MGIEERFEQLRRSAACAHLSRDQVSELVTIGATLVEEREVQDANAGVRRRIAARANRERPRTSWKFEDGERAGRHRGEEEPRAS